MKTGFKEFIFKVNAQFPGSVFHVNGQNGAANYIGFFLHCSYPKTLWEGPVISHGIQITSPKILLLVPVSIDMGFFSLN